MKVLHVHAGNMYGGVETFLTILARQHSLCPSMKPHFALCFKGRLADNLNTLNSPIHWLGEVRTRLPWTVCQARQQLNRLLRQEKFDVVICHSCWAQAILGPAVKQVGIPLVFFCHDIPQGKHWLERWAKLTVPNLVLANSQHTQTALSCLYPHTSSHIFYVPVEGDLTGEQTRRSSLDTPENAVVIVQVSRLERWKGQSLLIEALAELRDLPDWICWMVGGDQRPQETAYLEELKIQAIAAGITERVKFLGQRNDVPALLTTADIFCQPNTSPEPFGIVFIEALYAGLPVVTTAIGGGAEILGDSLQAENGNLWGRLVPPKDPLALAQALKELILNPEVRLELSTRTRARARALCDPQQQLQQLYDLLLEVMCESQTCLTVQQW